MPAAEASEWIVRFAGLVPPAGRVLDVAAGSGRHTRFFLERGHPVTAVDRDTSALADLKDDPSFESLECDLESGAPWPLAGREFDVRLIAAFACALGAFRSRFTTFGARALVVAFNILIVVAEAILLRVLLLLHRHRRLHQTQHAEIVLGVLEVVLAHHAIA